MQKCFLIVAGLLCSVYLTFGQQPVNDSVLNTPVTLIIKNKPVSEILEKITKSTGIDFTYSSDLLSLSKLRTVLVTQKPLKQVLNELFSGLNIGYKVIGNQIVLFPIKQKVASKFTVSGYVREKISKELLLGVNVYIPSLKIGTVTNTYGFYSITIPQTDSLTCVFSFVGYTPVINTVNLTENKELNIELDPRAELAEVTILGQKDSRQSENVRMSTINVPVAQIKSIPSLLGEKDVLKAIQLMPGVKKGGEGTSGFYVRGGSPDQNLIILDDAVVYNASHMFGFFSLFNGDALKSVELTKGGFPARFGGRLSSVLELNMKEGNKQEWHGEAGVGLISSRFVLEGPLKKDKSSILISGRRTYADLAILPFQNANKFGYYFYDLNAKINYDFGHKNKLYMSGYFGRDVFHHSYKNNYKTDKSQLYWGNATATLRWNHLYNSKLFSNVSFVYSKYRFLVSTGSKDSLGKKNYYVEYYSGIKDLSLKSDWDYLPNSKHWLKFGISTTNHLYEPHAFMDFNKEENIDSSTHRSINSFENALYIEDTYSPFNNFKVNFGSRLSSLFVNGNNYWKLEPRISLAWRFMKNTALKASYAEMNQYIHLLSNTGIGLPTDLWVPATDKVKPQTSKQVAAGIYWDIPWKDLTFSVEGYYKKMNNILTYKNGATFVDIALDELTGQSSWEDKVTPGKGQSYGVEFLLQRKFGKFSGWLGYTLSWTKHQFDSINLGREYFARYDRRHDISIVGVYNISPKITLSATWVYGTGNAITIPTSTYLFKPHTIYNSIASGYDGWRFVDTFSEKNGFRMEPYHRMDVSIQFHKKKKWGERTWELSFYNVYNQKNPFFYSSEGYGLGANHSFAIKKISLFPIIPSVTYSVKF